MRAITHRTYANWSVDALTGEMRRLGIPTSALVDQLDTRGDRTGRWCVVQVLVEHANAGGVS